MTTGMFVEGLIIAIMLLAAYKGYLMFTGKAPMSDDEKDKYTHGGILAAVILGLTNLLVAIDPKLKDKFGMKEKAEKL